jgi:monofunctional biosynthetic peptidoglycan transglycosylase
MLAMLLLLIWFVPPVYRLRGGTVTVTRYTKKEGEITAKVTPGGLGWTSLRSISRHTFNAIVAAEDGKFYQHFGLDLDEIQKSVETNLRKKRYARGGSTITQQVVKMAFLGREKTLLRKSREAVGAILLEWILPKDRILEWYVNLAEFGDGVYGIGNGAWHYFRTKPGLLSIEQSVHLALVLPSPNAWSRGLRRRTLTPFGHKRFTAILNRMRQSGYITKTQWMTSVTRGDFGRPLNGYAKLLAAEEEDRLLCPGSPGCPETDDVDTLEDDGEDLTFPRQFPPPGPPPSNTTPAPPPGVPATLPEASEAAEASGASEAEPPESPTPVAAPQGGEERSIDAPTP